ALDCGAAHPIHDAAAPGALGGEAVSGEALVAAAWPHVASLVCCAARLLPLAFFCPALGGQLASAPIKLGLALSFAMALHFSGGVALHAKAVGPWLLAAAAVRELVLGLGLGILAALPYDVARMTGRWMDTFRGASAEAVLPLVGSQEAA